MPNEYYDATPITAHTTARSAEVNAQTAAIEAGLDKLPSEDNLKRGKVQGAVDSGTPNAYILTATHAKATYAEGDTYRFRALNTNSSTATVNIKNASAVLIGVVQIRNYAGAVLSGGEIVADAFTTISYDASGGYFRIESPLASVASVSVSNTVKGDGTDGVPGTLDDKVTVSGSLVKSVVDTGGGNRKVNIAFQLDEGLAVLQAGVLGI